MTELSAWNDRYPDGNLFHGTESGNLLVAPSVA
jgi:hypothetical protein